MYGQNAATSTFGQPSAFNTTVTPFGGIGTQPQQTSLFGQTANTTSLFGMSQPNSSSIFGSSQPTNQTSGFGSQFGGSLFSTQNQQPQATSLFGGNNRFGTTNTFGTSTFSSMNVTSGTAIKFVPQTSTDTIMKNGQTQSSTINIRLQCITCMREYESKSLEELRIEDYAANRKGPQQQTGGGLFGSSTLNTTGFGQQSTTFGTPSSTSLFNNQNKAFGTLPSTTTTTTSLFGSSLNSTNTGGLFGGNTSMFNQQQTTENKGLGFFNSTVTSQAPVGGISFGGNAFASNTNTAAPSAPSLFNAPNSTSVSQSSSFFPLSSLNTASKPFNFGQNTSLQTPFGQQQSTSTSLFAANPTANNTSYFSQTSQPSLFNTANNSLTTKPNFSSNLQLPSNTGFNSTNQGSSSLFQTNNSTLGGTNLNTGGSMFGNQSYTGGLGMFGTQNTQNQSVFQPSLSSFNFNPTGAFSGSGTSLTSTGFGTQPLQQSISTTGSHANSDQIITRLQTLPYGPPPQFSIDSSTSINNIKTKFTTDPKTLNQYKINAKAQTEVKVSRVPSIGKPATLLFDGLDDESADSLKCAQDIFQPRQNIKQLILGKGSNSKNDSLLKNSFSVKLPLTTTINNENSFNKENFSPDQHQNSSLLVASAQKQHQSLDDTIGLINKLSNDKNSQDNQKSNQKKDCSITPEKSFDDSNRFSSPSSMSNVVIHQSSPLSVTLLKCGIKLTRSGYYTIPTIEECDSFYNSDDDTCIVENFTVGRVDYGSIYWKGPLNVKGLNLDEIVHIRRKEVIVYPDDESKPSINEGLNRPAQVTLDQVWPIDKTTRESIKDTERIRTMRYAERIEKATIKLDAIFKEYRPDTGSWVFTVKHFSKYGLDADDEDVEMEPVKVESNKTAFGSEKKIFFNNKKENEVKSLFGNLTNEDNKEKFQLPKQESNLNIDNFDTDFSSLKENNFPNFNKNHRIFNEENQDDDFEFKEKSIIKSHYQDEFKVMRSALFSDINNQCIDDEESMTTVTKKNKNTSFTRSPIGSQRIVSLFPAKISSGLPKKRKLILKPKPTNLRADISSVCYSPFAKAHFFNGSNKFCFFIENRVFIFEMDLVELEKNHNIDKLEEHFESQSTIQRIESNNATIDHFSLIRTNRFSLNPKFDVNINSLIEALYGELKETCIYSRYQERINLILNWLFNYNKTLPVPGNDKPFNRIIHFFTTNELEFAVTDCLNSKQPRLSYLVACGPLASKDLLVSQLDSWKKSKADTFINKDLLRVYVVLAGLLSWTLSNGESIQSLEGLQWTQQIVLLLLYKTQSGEDIDIVGTNVLKSSVEKLISTPNTVEYHLLAQHPPWVVVGACTKPIDSWFLQEALQSYSVIIDDALTDKSDFVNLFLSSQINDLRWSLFFVLHIKNEFIRNFYTKELLTRNAAQLTTELKSFLRDRYLIDSKLISDAESCLEKNCPKTFKNRIGCN